MSDLPKFYIINNGMKDLRGHYYETSISIAEAAKDLGWHPILTGHASCEFGIVPSWLEFYPIFRTDHWMSSPPKYDVDDEIQINLKKYKETPFEDLLNNKGSFKDYIKARFIINPALSQLTGYSDNPPQPKKFAERIKQIYNDEGIFGLTKKITKKILREFMPPLIFRGLKNVLSLFRLITKNKQKNQDRPQVNMDVELSYAHMFYLDLSKILAITNAKEGDFVFLPTAHGRELLVINEILNQGNKGLRFGLEFRHALEFPLNPLPNGMVHPYVDHHSFYFDAVRKKGLPPEISLYTDTQELATDYEIFSNLPFQVLPIPFRQNYLMQNKQLLPSKEKKTRLVYLGDPREEKGFHWLPFLVDFLAKDYFETNKIIFHIQASVNSASEPRCLSALRILKSYSEDWIKFYGIDGPLTPDNYYLLLNQADIVLCPYDKATYRSRSSGTLTEAIAAGVPTIVPAKTWLESQQPVGTGLTFDGLENFLIQTKSIIDNYASFSVKAYSSKDVFLNHHDPKNLIKNVTKNKTTMVGPTGARYEN